MAKANSLSHKLERKSVEVIVDKVLKGKMSKFYNKSN